MAPHLFNSNHKTGFTQWQCFAIYGLLVTPFIFCVMLAENKNRIVFHLLLFGTGWLTFTFLEYIAHRFWMHGKKKKNKRKDTDLHLHHHGHPGELRITSGMRIKLFSGNVLLLATTIAIDNYFTAITGFYSGFVYYCFMHVLLHKPYGKKLFPYLQASHIHHHCKYPDKCFGVSVGWWDRLFKTGAGKDAIVSNRQLSFYFNNITTKK